MAAELKAQCSICGSTMLMIHGDKAEDNTAVECSECHAPLGTIGDIRARFKAEARERLRQAAEMLVSRRR